MNDIIASGTLQTLKTIFQKKTEHNVIIDPFSCLVKLSLLTIFAIFVLNLASTTNAQVVCSLDELTRELYDDIIDNGKN